MAIVVIAQTVQNLGELVADLIITLNNLGLTCLTLVSHLSILPLLTTRLIPLVHEKYLVHLKMFHSLFANFKYLFILILCVLNVLSACMLCSTCMQCL